MSYLLYFNAPQYLADWFIHECGSEPCRLKRGSVESDVLEYYLQRTPMDVIPDSGRGANLRIVIPCYSVKDPRIFNYLTPAAKQVFVSMLQARFAVNLWMEIHRLENIGVTLTQLIYAFMDRHGIRDDGKAWENIRQMYYRRRNAYKGKTNRRMLKFLQSPGDL